MRSVAPALPSLRREADSIAVPSVSPGLALPPAKDVYKVVVCLPPDFAGIVYYKIIAKWDSERGDVYGSRVW